MEQLIPSIYDIEFWRNISIFSIAFSTILAMIIFRLISDIKTKIELIIKKMESNFREEEFTVENRNKSKLYRVREE